MDSVSDEPNLKDSRQRLNASDDAGVWGEPALASAPSAECSRREHRAWLAGQWDAAATTTHHAVLIALVATSGLIAVATALIKGTLGLAVLAVVIGAPVIEEVAKSMGPLMVLEKRPWLFGSASSIVSVGIASGLVFATIENLLYFFVYIPEEELTPGLVYWRLIACTLLHVACATISCTGLARGWKRAAGQKAAFNAGSSVSWLFAAIAVHGLYNLGAVVYDLVL